jgi:dimethylhistidine N-methyltransferase
MEACGAVPLVGSFASDVLDGLCSQPKKIPSRYFYDDRGSQLFRQIMELDEYYLTRCEAEILERAKSLIGDLFLGRPFRLVELGPGDGQKTKTLLRHLAHRGLECRYVPVDICEEILVHLTDSLEPVISSSSIDVRGIVAEYSDALNLLNERTAERNLVLFLGSNIGNFHFQEARQFLDDLRASLNVGDYLLIGFDLKKDLEVLYRAYNDSQGVTREFNFNLLDRINRELGGNFDRRRFIHYGPYNFTEGRMESWLVSTESQDVEIADLDRVFSFEPWEGIHVEYSYKYDLSQIKGLAKSSGFTVARNLFDSRRYFTDSLWRAI